MTQESISKCSVLLIVSFVTITDYFLQKTEDKLVKATKDASKITTEVIHGMMTQVPRATCQYKKFSKIQICKLLNSPLNFSGNQGQAVQPPEAGHVSLQGGRARSTSILGLRRAHGKLTLRYIIHLILVYLLHLKYVPDVKCMKPKMSKCCPVPFTNTYLKRLYRIYKTALNAHSHVYFAHYHIQIQ